MSREQKRQTSQILRLIDNEGGGEQEINTKECMNCISDGGKLVSSLEPDKQRSICLRVRAASIFTVLSGDDVTGGVTPGTHERVGGIGRTREHSQRKQIPDPGSPE